MSNWQKLKNKLVKEISSKVEDFSSEHALLKKRKRSEINDSIKEELVVNDVQNQQKQHLVKFPEVRLSEAEKKKYVGLDCEMVGLGPSGKLSALARCSLVNFEGEKIYDSFVRPKGFVTDFRTKYSGVRSKDLRHGEAISFEECQKDVADLIRGKVLVGHALKNDLTVLMLGHNRNAIRDTAKYRPYMRCIGKGSSKWRPRALKDLTRQHLGLTIQTSEHDPGEDARCAMLLYRKARVEWERSLVERKKVNIEKSMHLSSSSTTNSSAEQSQQQQQQQQHGGLVVVSNTNDKKRINNNIINNNTNALSASRFSPATLNAEAAGESIFQQQRGLDSLSMPKKQHKGIPSKLKRQRLRR